MPSADQVKALIASLSEGDEAQFYSIAMQIAAHEARLGHGKLAEELRALIDKAKSRAHSGPSRGPIPLARPRGEVAELLTVTYPPTKLSDMVLSEGTRRKLERVIREHKAVRIIRSRGLSPRRKLLLIGTPGTGKTLTAAALAGDLGLPLFVVRLDALITKFMGETAAKLRLIFEALSQTRGVYLFDEFDSIGSARGLGNDVGEVRRIVNSFLQMVEQDDSDSLVVAATNHAEILDRALFRRFDDVIEYDLPDKARIALALRAKLSGFRTEKIQWAKAAAAAQGLSFADIARACEEAIKDAIVHDRQLVTHPELMSAIRDRKSAVPHKGTN
ncbi:ATP-binding protein [Rhodoplanes sp. TEM]|uniref:ATP-binding protein n=1 Tax=Rhodoplanes tepidamans TaxID=200616 RepID=A0ABT5JIX7_RHOTP|nr:MULTISPECIES: ATP-binding protein [Rhodoplanes]MDC7789542.1 ATP-binding protein [Rhodoplanes tepidamans]MDC7987832.1 ATP-binding protein [Rhodoplanes sp. TEM]MDQ0353994.1 SpoVK/Ycf46/Vps4 family AAA+-type ATPase [Rhodoplanes tepidamans]